MKINGFEVEHSLVISDEGMLTGWFETPALPHVTYSVVLDMKPLFELAEDKRLDAELAAEAAEEIELQDVNNDGTASADAGPAPAAEQVQLPGGEVAAVVPTPAEVETELHGTADEAEAELHGANDSQKPEEPVS